MSQQKDSAKCKHCGNSLPLDHKGPCPKCGQTGKNLNIHVNENILIIEKIGLSSIREYYEKNPWAIFVVIAITLVSSFVGLIFTGILGILIGLGLGTISFIVGPKAVEKVKEVHTTKFS